ncbi:GAF domain-containing protein [Salipaludibacillus aurantiacus]|uniref:RsbT co-antagonist protein RsbR n=1 Tax=Salipaludibacillus aurantiacus TaxID=1601833 RepID=A0A1H9UQU7_9BACI|nr:GAF domain-containing protein [Salipaludibacillus aurantiacus]SES11447.1 rsbT co-antagonist protein RsbR [Salipaludibacillus aurantiacus]
MSDSYPLSTSDFQLLKNAANKIFEVITNRLNVNTAYVTRKGETAMTVLSSFNKEEEIIPEGYSVEYGGTYCRLIISNPSDTIRTSNLANFDLTKELAVTGQLKTKGFIGVTLRNLDGEVFGTLCVMDREEKDFSDHDRDFLYSMADIFSHLIELDETKYNMGLLNVPIIPITKGVAILTIQGIIDDKRAEHIMNTVLRYAAENNNEHFIFDVSGLVILDNKFPEVVTEVVNCLNVMGVQAIVTGISPDFALQNTIHSSLKGLEVKTAMDLETALEHIGFQLTEK